MCSEENLYSIALRACPLIGDVNFSKIVEAVGTAKDAWNLSRSLSKEIYGIGNKIVEEIGKKSYLEFAEKELNFCQREGIQIKLKHRDQYPGHLSECSDAPAILYQKGVFDEYLIPVSIVGTRKITSYGRQFLETLFEAFPKDKIMIVSGLALGTDGYAHQQALKNNISTIGILAHGLHTLYPSSHRNLVQQMLQNGGALLSEFNSSKKPDREHFLQRNRVVAGISQFTIVVETAFGGGSMSTVSYANGYNREVYALPGKLTDKYSQGCNLIISQNKAKIISSVQDILDELNFYKQDSTLSLFPPREIALDESIMPVYRAIERYGTVSLDELSLLLEIPCFKLLSVLLDLEIRGYVKALSGRNFSIA